MKKLVSILFTLLPVLAFTAESSSYDLSKRSHNHHKQDCERGPVGLTGPIGPTGPTGGRFTTPVVGDTLTATVAVPDTIFTAPAGSYITPFVSTPDGFVAEGTPVLISALPTTLTFPTVSPVTAGTHIYGLLTSGSDIVATPQILPVIISSSTEGISTTVNIFIPEVTLTTSEAQFSASFVYNAPAFP